MDFSNYKTELRRVLLLPDLPEPLTRASEHWQLFDNYIENTRLRLRYIRIPQTKEWRRSLQQRFPADENDLLNWQTSEINFNEDEYAAFEPFEGREIRKNRYFFEADQRNYEIDVYIGNLWGLCLAKTYFDSESELRNFEKPGFAIADVSGDKFFLDENLVGKKFADVQQEWAAKAV
ncbi:MAG: hypothetical protein ACR2L1_06020 [Pyrinomonadaceae bacterium]